jgi:hypothetical protein
MGDFLDNNVFMPCSWRWYEALDELLEPAGVPIRFAKLTEASPIPIPPPDEWPMMGHWTHEIVASKEPLDRLLAAGVSNGEDAAALQLAYEKWIVPACDRPDSMIVGFHG